MKNHNKPKYMFVKVQGAYLSHILIVFWLIYGIIDMITSGHTLAEQAIAMGDNTGSLRRIKCTAFTESPVYLWNLLTLAPVGRSGLRSNEQYRRLLVPFTKLKTFAARSFSCIGPYWWNRLPNHIRQHNDINLFKKDLKTYLFTNLHS